jgi:hypothetical protein
MGYCGNAAATIDISILIRVEDLGVIRVKGSYETLENTNNVIIIYLQLLSPIIHFIYN